MILNLTQHAATEEQKAAGVVDMSPVDQEMLRCVLTFSAIPTAQETWSKAMGLLTMAMREFNALGVPEGERTALIGGALWLMEPLAIALRDCDIKPVFSFSQRESAEETRTDGSVVKTNVFRHVGFVEA